jgi:integrase
VAALIDRYLERQALRSRPRSLQSARSCCKRLRAHLGERRVGTLGAEDLEAFVALRLNRDEVGREAVNRDLRYLRAVLRLAVEEGRVDAMPFKVKMLRTVKKLPTILSEEELERLFAAADDRLRPLMVTAAMTGLRHSELASLRWEDVDRASRTIAVTAKPEVGFVPKSHAEREVPVNSALAQVLAEHRRRLVHRQRGDFVFQRNPRRGTRWEPSALCAVVRETFKRARLYRKQDRPGLHMLRRSFASHALATGADVQTVRELGGWASLAVVERYLRSADALKREAVERLARLAS